jgi:S1-C subfamily serine protease
MRRFPALLCVAGLAAAPASAVAGPSNDPWSVTQSRTVEKFEWSTSKGRLGVMVMSLTPELRKHFGAPDDRGVLVAHVEPDTPAAKAGVEVGDVIAPISAIV